VTNLSTWWVYKCFHTHGIIHVIKSVSCWYVGYNEYAGYSSCMFMYMRMFHFLNSDFSVCVVGIQMFSHMWLNRLMIGNMGTMCNIEYDIGWHDGQYMLGYICISHSELQRVNYGTPQYMFHIFIVDYN